ncbi:MAG: cyclic nucleotide-binding domain-containing protein, partial [Blastocatellia bacterium]
TLAIQGQALNELILISDGRVVIEIGGETVAHLRSGQFVGEMSMVTGGMATATVRTEEAMRYLAWSKAALEQMLRRYPSMRFAMQVVLSADLTRKLLRENKQEAGMSMVASA